MNVEQRHLKLELDRIFRFIYKVNNNGKNVLDLGKIPKTINDLEMLRRKIKGSYANLATNFKIAYYQTPFDERYRVRSRNYNDNKELSNIEDELKLIYTDIKRAVIASLQSDAGVRNKSTEELIFMLSDNIEGFSKDLSNIQKTVQKYESFSKKLNLSKGQIQPSYEPMVIFNREPNVGNDLSGMLLLISVLLRISTIFIGKKR